MRNLDLEIPKITITDKKLLTKYVAAFMLGDGALRMFPRGKNSMYCLSQIAEHEDYVLWQAGILSNITSVQIYEYPEKIQSQGALAKRSFRMNTKCHPFYTTLYERTYIDGHKVVSPHDLKLLDWESVAIWYMDDGFYQTNSKTSIFCSDCYSFGDCLLLKKALYEKLGIQSRLVQRKLKNNYGYRVNISRESMGMFLVGIEPYIFPSFRYKLGSRMNDPSNEGDEIVCSSLRDEEMSRDDSSLEFILE